MRAGNPQKQTKMKTQTLNTKSIQALLEKVMDPEIPVISLVDLGVIHEVRVDGEKVEVDMIPTFSGCPAISMMQSDIRKACMAGGATEVKVNVLYQQEWTTNLISDKGRKLIHEFGLSPPPKFKGCLSQKLLDHSECPKCGSKNTYVMSNFGPTPCRAIHHCNNCHETFEQMKPL
jgi:ring-1,2-phenylacetyl-CoA epoxidase subunit PaaD